MRYLTAAIHFVFFIFFFSCNTVFAQNILIDEDFSGTLQNGLPDLWSQSTLSNDGGWLNGTSSDLQSEYWGIAPHGTFIATNDDACDCNKSEDYLIMPPLNFSNLDNAILSFAGYFSGEAFEGSTDRATIEYSLDGGYSWIELTEIAGNGNADNTVWENHNINLTELLDYNNVLLAFHYDDDGGWMFGWAIDDVVIYEPVGLNAEMTLLSFPTNIQLGTAVSIEGVISNTGTDVIESFDIVWSEGGSMSYSQSYSNLYITSGNSYTFTHQDQFFAESAGLYNIDVTVTNVNGQQDEDLTNNSLNNSIMVIEYGELYSGGFQRDYIYFKPSSAPTSCPLVFVCHGYTGNANDIMNYSHFNDLAIEYGFAVCYPQGIEDSGGNTFFNVGYDFQNNETVDDVAFLEDLISVFSADNSIDTDKVFCTGMSNGGDFCYLLACEASESFSGVAPISGMIMQDIMDNCTPSENVGILEIHGTQDNVTYYNGDVNNQDGWGAYPSIPSTIDFFVDLYDLELNATGNFPNTASNDGSTVSYDKYGVEEECAKVWLYTVNGGGHDWPGAYGNMDIDSSREAWLFFDSLCGDEAPAGCTDSVACNFNPSSIEDDGTCTYAEDGYDCGGVCINDTNGDGVCDADCPEDLNADGYITIQDILLVLSEFGCASLCNNDITQDGVVAVDDILQILSSFGNACEGDAFQNCGDAMAYDGHDYSTVQIGDQCWFSENCRYLPEVSPSNEQSSNEPHYYVYGYEGTDIETAKGSENYEAYGVLYNWPAVVSDDICPIGWHNPSDEEWQTLEISLGMSESIAMELDFRGTDEGSQMKSISGWFSNGNGTNTSGFNSKPGGLLSGIGFYGLELHGFWWTSTASVNSYLVRQLVFADDAISRQYENPTAGFSARCIRD